MLSLPKLSNSIDSVLKEDVSAYDFERWFRAESRDAHLWGDPDLIDAVFAIEAVFSEYHFADLKEDALGPELAKAILPFKYRQLAVLLHY